MKAKYVLIHTSNAGERNICSPHRTLGAAKGELNYRKLIHPNKVYSIHEYNLQEIDPIGKRIL